MPKKAFILFFVLTIICQCFTCAYAKKVKYYTAKDQYKYDLKRKLDVAKENYQKSLLPQSGYMTREEYEKASNEISTSQRKVGVYKQQFDPKMEYVPIPTYELARYNDPPGAVDLKIGRKFNYDRVFNCPGVTSPNKDFLVFPTVYYYAENQCVASDLFIIPLDTKLPDVERIMSANIMHKIRKPIMSTQKTLEDHAIFRSLTPIDFSKDGSKLLVKEKVGNIYDGIWQTNIWIYDFKSKTVHDIPEIKEAIKFYWLNSQNLDLEEKRWDIYPLGFSDNDDNRIVVTSYGYTGVMPKFLGTWSVDIYGEKTLLDSLFKVETPVSQNGYKIVKSGVLDPAIVYNMASAQKKQLKKDRKTAKKIKKAQKKEKKRLYKKEVRKIKQEARKQFYSKGKVSK